MWGKRKEQGNILIIGGFHKARSLANSLLKKGYHVTVVNKEYADCEKLAEVSKINVIYGDGSKRFILEDAGASDCIRQKAIPTSSCQTSERQRK